MGKTRLLESFFRGSVATPGGTAEGPAPGHDAAVLRAAGAASGAASCLRNDPAAPGPYGTGAERAGKRRRRPQRRPSWATSVTQTKAREDGIRGSVNGYGDRLLAVMTTLAGAGRVLVLCASDIELSDTASLQVLLDALRRAGQLPLLTLLTLDPEHAGPHELPSQKAEALEDLLRLPGAQTIVLGPLTPTEVQGMWRAGPGRVLPMPAARALVDHTGGDPRLIRSLLEEFPLAAWYGPTSRCLHRPAVSRPPRLPSNNCQPAARRWPRQAAVPGRELATAPGSGALPASTTPGTPVAAINSAAAAGLQQPKPGSGPKPGANSPSPVLRSAVHQDLGPALRTELHTTTAAAHRDLRWAKAQTPGRRGIAS